LRESDTI